MHFDDNLHQEPGIKLIYFFAELIRILSVNNKNPIKKNNCIDQEPTYVQHLKSSIEIKVLEMGTFLWQRLKFHNSKGFLVELYPGHNGASTDWA